MIRTNGKSKRKDNEIIKQKFSKAKLGRNRGITLIALVITIIVLLILAAITLATLSGENGILKQAQRARLENKRATVKEIIKIAETDEYIEHRDESDRVILEATQKHLKNPKSPLYSQGKEVKVDENIYGENSGEIYFYVVVDDDIYKVTRKDVEIIGQVDKKNVELQKEEMTINQNPTIWTKDKVTINIEAKTDKIIDYAIKYKIHYKTVEELEAEKATGDGTEKVAQTSTEQATTEEWQTYTNEFEVEKNCIIYAKLEGINGETSVVTGNVMKIDKLDPKEFTPEITEVTTNSITVKASTTDEEETNEYGCSGVKQYRFRKNGESWSNYQDSGIYKFNNLLQETNYTIEVEAKDEAENTKIGTVTKTTGKVPGLVESTGTQTGNVTFTYSEKNWTNKNVTVTATTTVEGYTLRSSIDGEHWSDETSRTFSENGNMYVKLWDGTNYGGFATGTVSNIDKDAPTIGTYSSTPINCITARLTLTSATDKASKISKIIWYYKGPTDSKHTSVTTDYSSSPITSINANTSRDISVTFNNNYDTYVEVYDVAGNKATSLNTTAKGNTTHNQVQGGTKASDATCTEPAKYYYKCSVCGTQLNETYTLGNANGHKPVEGGNLVSNATCISPSVYHYKCGVCGIQLDSTYEKGPKGGHITRYLEVKDDPCMGCYVLEPDFLISDGSPMLFSGHVQYYIGESKYIYIPKEVPYEDGTYCRKVNHWLL